MRSLPIMSGCYNKEVQRQSIWLQPIRGMSLAIATERLVATVGAGGIYAAFSAGERGTDLV